MSQIDPARLKGYLVRDGAERARTAPSMKVETVVFVSAGILWLWSGLSTWHDLIGHPRDAPFLRIPGHFRSLVFWWIPATYALACAWLHKHVNFAFFLLTVGPTIRVVSYAISWASSWPWLDDGIPHSFLWGHGPRFIYGHGIDDNVIKGDPHAWGSMWIYAALLVGIGGFTYLCRLLRDMEEKVNTLQIKLAQQRIAKASVELGVKQNG